MILGTAPSKELYDIDASVGKYIVMIDSVAHCGYYETRSHSCGGGLWFEKYRGNLTLEVFDGLHFLPLEVIGALEAKGIVVPDKFK